MKRMRVYLPIAFLCLSICTFAVSCENKASDVETDTETETDTEICSQATQELPIDELLSRALCGSVEYADLPDYIAFRNAITAEIADSIGTNPDWSELTVYVSDTPRDERYQYTVLLPKDEYCQYLFEFGVMAYKIEDETRYGFESSGAMELYGSYAKGDEIILTYDGKCINKTEMLRLLIDSDITASLKGSDTRVENGNIYISQFAVTTAYQVTVNIGEDYGYTLTDLRLVDIGSISVNDFFNTYLCFTLKPMELIEYGIDIAISPANSPQLGIPDKDPGDMYIVSEFLPQPYIRIKTDERDDTYILCDSLTGAEIDIADIPPDTGYDRYYWRLQE